MKDGGTAIMIWEKDLAKTKNAYNILEVVKARTGLEVPIHKLMLFESEKAHHEGKAAFEPDACSSEIQCGTNARDALYVSYPDECSNASSSAQARDQKK